MKRYIRVDGRRVAAFDAIGQGPVLVCVPGGPGYGGDQLARLGGLSATRSLVRLDLRGAGESDVPVPATWSFNDYADDLELVRLELGLDRMDLLGHAHGGLSVAAYAARYPDHVGSVILDGVPVRSVVEFDSWAESDVPDYFAEYDSRAAHYMTDHMGKIHEPAMAWFWDNESTVDFRALVARVTAPTLLLTGQYDPMAGAPAVESLAALMPRATAAVVPQAAHFAWVENPAAYTDAVETFLRSSVRV